MMAEANDKISILSQNLTDAGCNEQMAKTCMSFVEKVNFTQCCLYSQDIEQHCLIAYVLDKNSLIVSII